MTEHPMDSRAGTSLAASTGRSALPMLMLMLCACSRSQPSAAAPEEVAQVSEDLCGPPPPEALQHPCSVEPLEFAPGESELRAEHRCQLEALATCIRGERLGELLISAHAIRDGVRTEEESMELAGRRVDSVRRELNRLNIRCVIYINGGFLRESASRVDIDWSRRNPADCIRPLVPLCDNPDVPGGFAPASECASPDTYPWDLSI